MKFITIIVIMLLSIASGFISNKLYRNTNNNTHIYKTKTRLYNKLEKNENSIGFYEDDDPIYIVISFKNDLVTQLLEDMDYFGLQAIYCDMQNYEKDELDEIFQIYIKNKNFNYKTQPWIFENNKFIGGLFEIYTKIYKNI